MADDHRSVSAVLPVAYVDQIRYYDSGPPEDIKQAATPLVLLHGLGASLDFWTAVAPSLARDRRVVALDVPGFGGSAAPSSGFNLESVVAAIERTTRRLDLKDFVLVGHSLGGIVALALAKGAEASIERLVLIDGHLLRASRVLKRPRNALRDPILTTVVAAQFIGGLVPFNLTTARLLSLLRPVREITLWPFVARPSELDRQVLAYALADNGGIGVLRALGSLQGLDLRDLMADLPCPVDLIWGRSDRLLNSEDLIEARTLMPIAHEEQINDCGHWPMVERPEKLIELLRRS